MAQLISGLCAALLVVITTVLYYEILNLTWRWLPGIHIPRRRRVILAGLASFAGHMIAVTLYGLAYFLLSHFGLGALSGAENASFMHYLYFSAETYSSLGIGDVFPTQGFQILVGIEAINGLVLIGWSVAFTFLAMQQYWDDDSHAGK